MVGLRTTMLALGDHLVRRNDSLATCLTPARSILHTAGEPVMEREKQDLRYGYVEAEMSCMMNGNIWVYHQIFRTRLSGCT